LLAPRARATKRKVPSMMIPSRYVKNGTFCKVTCRLEAGDRVSGFMSRDGTFYYFARQDIEALLKKYPADNHGWFFNQTRDRYIAENTPYGVSVNPVFIEKHFVERIYE